MIEDLDKVIAREIRRAANTLHDLMVKARKRGLFVRLDPRIFYADEFHAETDIRLSRTENL